MRLRRRLHRILLMMSEALELHQAALENLEERVTQLEAPSWQTDSDLVVFYQCPTCSQTIRSDTTHVCGMS